MSLSRILEDWSDYDDKKKKAADRRDFSCTEKWEVDYLIDKIVKVYTSLTRDQVRSAITACCNTVGAPHPRQAFVECVLKRLGLL